MEYPDSTSAQRPASNFKRSDTWVKERTWLRRAKYRLLSQRERQVLDTLLCMAGIDTKAGWRGSLRKLVVAYEEVTGSHINWQACGAAVKRLVEVGLLEVDGKAYRANLDRVLPVHDQRPCTQSTRDRVPPVHAAVYPEFTPENKRTEKNRVEEPCSSTSVRSCGDFKDGLDGMGEPSRQASSQSRTIPAGSKSLSAIEDDPPWLRRRILLAQLALVGQGLSPDEIRAEARRQVEEEVDGFCLATQDGRDHRDPAGSVRSCIPAAMSSLRVQGADRGAA